MSYKNVEKTNFLRFCLFVLVASLTFTSCLSLSNSEKDYYLACEKPVDVVFTIDKNASHETKKNIRLQTLAQTEISDVKVDSLAEKFRAVPFNTKIYDNKKEFKLNSGLVMYVGRFTKAQMKELSIKIKKTDEKNYKDAKFSSYGQSTLWCKTN